MHWLFVAFLFLNIIFIFMIISLLLLFLVGSGIKWACELHVLDSSGGYCLLQKLRFDLLSEGSFDLLKCFCPTSKHQRAQVDAYPKLLTADAEALSAYSVTIIVDMSITWLHWEVQWKWCSPWQRRASSGRTDMNLIQYHILSCILWPFLLSSCFSSIYCFCPKALNL